MNGQITPERHELDVTNLTDVDLRAATVLAMSTAAILETLRRPSTLQLEVVGNGDKLLDGPTIPMSKKISRLPNDAPSFYAARRPDEGTYIYDIAASLPSPNHVPAQSAVEYELTLPPLGQAGAHIAIAGASRAFYVGLFPGMPKRPGEAQLQPSAAIADVATCLTQLFANREKVATYRWLADSEPLAPTR